MTNNILSTNVQYFHFEEDFIEDNVRCIPMIVRFKLDACMIKLKLAEWSRMNVDEREKLATLPCTTTDEIAAYHRYLCEVIRQRAGHEATPLVQINDSWASLDEVPADVAERVADQGHSLALGQWRKLSTLQRFALLKLSMSSHEHKNFPRALREFQLV